MPEIGGAPLFLRFWVSGLGLLLVLAACSPAEDPPAAATPAAGVAVSGGVEEEEPTLLPVEEPPSGAEREFSTDFNIHSVPYREILSGGPPKDGIPAIDEPRYMSAAEADEWLEDVEPVIRVEIGDKARAYPLQVLMWHEIVNDELGGEPVAVTFCPLCNTGLAFLRTLDGQVLDFGTTGRLRFSNLIMYDRQTESWWQQATGEAIVGELTGRRLEFIPAPIISWEQFKEGNPEGSVLSRETGFARRYGENPYVGYDDVNRPPFLYRGPELPDDLPPVARILAVQLNGESVAYPYNTLESVRVVNDEVGGEAIVVFWEEGTASALDSREIAFGRDVGTAIVYSGEVAGRTLEFAYRDGHFEDLQTGSEWNVLGLAVAGELAGTQLDEVLSFNHFWFSWAVFMPETRIYKIP